MERVLNDFLDLKIKRTGSLVDCVVALTAFDAAQLLLRPVLNLDEFGIQAATALSATVFLKPVLSVLGETGAIDYAKKPVFSDYFLGFRGQDLSYRGLRDLKLQQGQLKIGDSFVYLQLPSLSENATLSDWVDVSELALKGTRVALESYPYQAVALGLPKNTPAYIRFLFKYTPTFSKEKLLEGKSLEFKEASDQLPVLSKAALEGLVLSPQQVFLKGVNELADKSITDLLSLAKGLGIKEQRDKVKKLIENRLQIILQTQVQINFDGPELVAGKVRVNKTSLVKRNNGNGFTLVEIYENGEVRQKPLDRVLKSDPKDMNAALADQSSLRKAKIAYAVYQILQDIPFDELFKERILERNELVDHFRKEGITAAKVELDLGQVVDSSKTTKKQMRVFPKRLLPIMMTLLAYAGAQLGSAAAKDERLTTTAAYSAQAVVSLFERKYYDNPPSASSVPTVFKGSSSQLFSDSEAIGFPPRLAKTPDNQEMEINSSPWRIEVSGFPASGYFTESTSFLIDGLVWKANKARVSDDKLDLPLEVDKTLPNLKLERIVSLKRDQSTTLKIPIKSNTFLAALNITSPDGKPIPFDAYKLVDGTVRLSIPKADGFDQSRFANIEAGFYPMDPDQHQVHATGPVYLINSEGKSVLIARSQLNPSLIRYYQTIYSHSENGQQLMESLLARIKYSHLYSINPTDVDLEAMKKVGNIEQLMNVIDQMDVCDCNTCNSLFVALAALHPYREDPKINLGLGYLHNLKNPGSGKGSFLDSSKGHAYGIDGTGKIWDATPSIIAPGGLDSADESGTENDWNKMEQLVMQERKSREDVVYNLRFLALILGLVPAYGAGWLTYKGVRALTSAENMQKAKDKVILSTYSKEDLVGAHNFFGWASWGNVGMNDNVPNHNGFHSDKTEVLSILRSNLKEQRVIFYQQHPQSWPEPASALERAKLRILSRLLS